MRRRLFQLFFCLCFAIALTGNWRLAQAQDGGAIVHIVQRGDTLYGIAIRYGTTVEAIALANNIQDTATITVGQRLIIPNPAANAPGIPTAYVVNLADSLFSLAARFGTSIDVLAAQNAMLNPKALYVGQLLNVNVGGVTGNAGFKHGWVHVVGAGDTIWRVALRYGITSAALLGANRINHAGRLYPGQKLVIPGPPDGPLLHDLPLPFARIELLPAPMEQGRSGALRVVTNVPASISVIFGGKALATFSDASRTQHFTLIGIDSFAPVGLYALSVSAREDNGQETVLQHRALIGDAGYSAEAITLLPSQIDLLDPAVTGPEIARIQSIVEQVTPTRYFGGLMGLPCSAPVTSQFGTRRSYNGGPYDRIHSGTDFAGAPNSAIYAPAAGVVVLAEAMNVRGNAVILDHGWGVYTGYWHQAELKVVVGQVVQQGEVIGLVGQTGRVTGPHLHWELFVGGVQVDPLQWTKQSFP
jgi:murein DD-endopeptidase MepM/ murein hydrolase activator NlpD